MTHNETQQMSLADSARMLSVLPDNPKSAALRKQLANRLARHLSIAWIRDGDLGEVFLLLAAVWRYDPAYIDSDCFAAAVQRLIQCEQEPGGPYYSNGTVDLTANLQIAYFVHLVAKPLPRLDAFIHQAVASGRYQNELAQPYVHHLLTILYDNPQAVKHTTDHHLQNRHTAIALATKQLFDARAEPLRSSALAAVDKICSAERGLEITLFSYFFAQALKEPSQLADDTYTLLGVASVCGWIAYTVYDDFLDGNGKPAMLPAANVAMRASLDCFRAAAPGQASFQQYVSETFAHMDEANAWEVANCRFLVQADEITIARMPHYRKHAVLAARSFAHALGPMAVLAHHANTSAAQTRHVESAFRHYLIAHQLSDDLRDWYDDIRTGQASYVVTAILRGMHVRPGTYNLSILLSGMQKRFMRTTMEQICRLTLRHLHHAQLEFAKSQLLQPTNEIYSALHKLELSTLHSLDQHAKARALVKT